MVTPEQALHFFFPGTPTLKTTPLGEGKINDTWLVTLVPDRQIVLQRVPSSVFPQVELVMENIRRVLSELTKRQENAPPRHELLTLLTSPAGEELYLDKHGDGWRCFSYINKSRTQEQLTNRQQAESIGTMLGLFHTALRDLDPGHFHVPLPDFHNTAVYLKTLRQLLTDNVPSCSATRQCVQLLTKLHPLVDHFLTLRPTLSHQVIHGDPKVSNFLFAHDNDQVISIIDLDTVQPGLLLHDLGDCLRSCCNQSGEEHENPQDTVFSAEYFQAVLSGYAQTASDMLTPADLNCLPDAVGVLCYELGVRFFTDHLTGDTYFKTTRQGQNLDRALIQFHLARSVYEQQQNLHNLVAEIF